MTIDRAIEILNPEHREHYDGMDEVNEACRMGMEALERTRWIPVSERKPKKVFDERGKMIFFLGFTQEYGVRVVSYMPPVDVWNWLSLPVDVTYWMPLPKPPTEGARSDGNGLD